MRTNGLFLQGLRMIWAC